MSSEEEHSIAEYFVVAGLTENSRPLEEDLEISNSTLRINSQRKDPITDICVIDRTLEEQCPVGFTCIEETPHGFQSDLNHGSLTAHCLVLCYKRGKDKPPLIDLGVLYEGLETVKSGISIIETTPTGRSANVNNKSGMGSHAIYLTYRRAKESAPQNSLVVTDVCVILPQKGEKVPYAFCEIDKSLNKGLIGSTVHLCYKKSMRQVDSIAFKAGILGRYPTEDTGSFALPDTVPLFCLPMGAAIECWSSKTRHPLPVFSSFVLTTQTSEKIFGTVVSFYESYPESKLTEDQQYHLRLLRGDGQRSAVVKTVHTNKAICLLSRWPMFSAFKDFLMYLYRLTVSPYEHTVPVERHIAHFMHNIPFPSAQRPRVQYQMSPMHVTTLTRPQITPIPLSGASFIALLENLGPDNVLTLLVLALTEHKIVIHSLRAAEITCVAEALITLLFPFKWQCTYVPLCPLEMGYVLEAPCPFIVGVDSRYFDLFVPPADVACVNLDTNNITLMEEKKSAISWKMLPRKSAKHLRATLQRYFKELKEFPREEIAHGSSLLDPDLTRTERHRQIEIAIQESFLKMMASMMRGYRQFLLPITGQPTVGTTDPSSLFNMQEFVRNRERPAQRFFHLLVATQLFSSFVEERSLASPAWLTDDVGGDGGASSSRTSGLVFFDECIDRLATAGGDSSADAVRLIETDDSLRSEHTVMIMPPDEKGLPGGVGYQYTTFPTLRDELFDLGGDQLPGDEKRAGSMPRAGVRRKPDSFAHGRRTKQEVRSMQKISRLHSGNARLWARLLLSHTYGAWFACLPAFACQCRHKEAALRTAHNALLQLEEKGCLPLPDETYYRQLLYLCSVYNKPALAMRVFHFVKKSGAQLSAIAYGLYNKAVLEGTWPASKRDGYMLWQKLQHVLLATIKLRRGIRRRSFPRSDVSSDFDSTSDHTSVDSMPPARAAPAAAQTPPPPRAESDQDGGGVGGSDGGDRSSSVRVSANNNQNQKGGGASGRLSSSVASSSANSHDDSVSTGGQSDHGYNSMPKEHVRRTATTLSPLTMHHLVDDEAASPEFSANATPEPSSQASETRCVRPPSSLDIPDACGDDVTDPALLSDETVVNGDVVASPVFDAIPPVKGTTQQPLIRQDTEDNVFVDSQRQTENANNAAVTSPMMNNRSSPATPEIANLFGADSKFVSNLSDSDQMRYHELMCGRSASRASIDNLAVDGDAAAVLTRKKSASLLVYSPQHHHVKARSNSALFAVGGISPLIGQKQFLESSQKTNPADQVSRGHFDNLTADDIIMSPKTARSSSIFSNKSRSPSRMQLGSPKHRRRSYNIKTIGGNSLAEDIALLTSTPLRPLREPNSSQHLLESEKDDDNERDGDSVMDEARDVVKATADTHKKITSRQDISHLAEDPLSGDTLSAEDPLSASLSSLQVSLPTSESANSLKRHLLDEIEVYMNRDSMLKRCSSDATLLSHQQERLSKVASATTGAKSAATLPAKNLNELESRVRKSSLPSRSPKPPRKQEAPLLSRSITLGPSGGSGETPTGWFSSPSSKLNSLLRTTTIEQLTNKAKKVASSWAKEVNDTVQQNIAYYTNGDKQGLGSTGDLSFRGTSKDDRYSSQTSLKSTDSIHSTAADAIKNHKEKVRRRAGRQKERGSRPSSMPPYDGDEVTRSSNQRIPPQPGLRPPPASSDPSTYSSMTSLNTKGMCAVEVTISSCSKCHQCESLVYDEEIMAGWIADDSNLNTHCPFCNSLFVPFLNIEVKDYRAPEARSLSTPRSDDDDGDADVTATDPQHPGRMRKTSDDNQTDQPPCSHPTVSVASKANDDVARDACAAPDVSSAGSCSTSEVGKDQSSSDGATSSDQPSSDQLASDNGPNGLRNDADGQQAKVEDSGRNDARSNETRCEEDIQTDTKVEGLRRSPVILEPVTFPYLSSLVLRKELESLLENEGTDVLTRPQFIDHHPIIYWNLIWYFRRLNLHSNLYNLLLSSQFLNSSDNPVTPGDRSGNVLINLMWDNMKLQEDADKPPLYCVWHHLARHGVNPIYCAYPPTLIHNIKDSIMQDDVRGPLVALLNALQAHGGVRRSTYREILYLVIVALGKTSIDIDAFDREYARAFQLLAVSELALTKRCDRPPSDHVVECRRSFGELDLYK